MSKRLLKCYGTCGEKYPQSELTKYKNANHCLPCYQAKVKEVEDREKLYELIKKTFNLNFPTGLMLKQVKQFREERQYTYKNIAFTIDYIVRIKKMKLHMQYGIALVPHFYDEMIAYYKDLKRRREQMKDIKPRKVTVKMQPPVLENEYRKKKLINMEDLLK
ncbi:hypothetical protein [Bacillus wiedmannii]|uniref:hypothetical protein n=1 Tax=Bacillus wiedmannii TaxID=1890302 RepID=UPI000BF0091E|nr:hypothetical protein [Bacillus wiedmannii]PEN61657.1 hypothetical protein CN576_21745 [Bacillus wiedmannii]PHA62901.1 hypothetical protein COE75_16845 [Bacillus wiedmannii]